MTFNQSVRNHFDIILLDGKKGIQSVLIACPEKKVSKKRVRGDNPAFPFDN
jgi:hypothetical protein